MQSAEQLLSVLWRRRASFALTFMLVLAAVAAATYALPKAYSTSAFLWVSTIRQSASDFEATQTNQALTKSYAELLQTRGVANQVAATLPFRATGSEVQGGVKIAPVTQSQLIQITAESSSAERAQIMANTYARVFQAKARTLNVQNGNTARVTVAEPAPRISSPVRPKPKLYLVVGAVLAAFAAAGVALLRQRLDQRLEIDSDTTEVLGLPVLARIPQRAGSGLARARGGERDADAAQVAEGFRLLVANLSFVNRGERPRSVTVVSAGESEGKSSCCMSIGLAATEMGVQTVLVDGDMRRPRLAAMLEVESEDQRGFSDLLAGTGPLSLNEVTVRAPGTDLQVIPPGFTPPNPASLLAQRGLVDVERRAAKLFNLVVFDTPPMSVGADASLLSAATEGTVLVIDARRTKRTAVVQAVDQLRRAGANVLGVVLNRVEVPSEEGYYGTTAPHRAEAVLDGQSSRVDDEAATVGGRSPEA